MSHNAFTLSLTCLPSGCGVLFLQIQLKHCSKQANDEARSAASVAAGAASGAVASLRSKQLKASEDLYTRDGQTQAEARQMVENQRANLDDGRAVASLRSKQLKASEDLYTRDGQTQAEARQMVENQRANLNKGPTAASNASLAKTNEMKWMTKYEELKKFADQHGHCNVPHGMKSSIKLYQWTTNQRFSHRASKLPNARFCLLDGIGFDWGPHKKPWIESYNELPFSEYDSEYDSDEDDSDSDEGNVTNYESNDP